MNIVPKNLSRDFLSQSQLLIREFSRVGKLHDAAFIKMFSEGLAVSPKFYIESSITGKDMDEVSERLSVIKIPFDSIVIEPNFPDMSIPTKMIFRYLYSGENLYMQVAIKGQLTNRWGLAVSTLSLSDERDRFSMSEADNARFVEHPESMLFAIQLGVIVLKELLEMLECSNVKVEQLPARKLNKSAATRGALPFDSYHILTIEPRSASDNSNSSPGSGTKKRQHLRRGSVVRPVGRKPFWRNGCVVNPNSTGGRVHKDYKVLK